MKGAECTPQTPGILTARDSGEGPAKDKHKGKSAEFEGPAKDKHKGKSAECLGIRVGIPRTCYRGKSFQQY